MAPKKKRMSLGVELAAKPSKRVPAGDKLYHAVELPDGRIVSGGCEEFILATVPSPDGTTIPHDNPRNSDGTSPWPLPPFLLPRCLRL